MTEKPRFSITLDESLFDRLERYRYEHKFSTRSKAAVHLIDIALNEMSENAALTADEQLVIDGYRAADVGVRHIMVQSAKVAILEKKENSEKLSASANDQGV